MLCDLSDIPQIAVVASSDHDPPFLRTAVFYAIVAVSLRSTTF